MGFANIVSGGEKGEYVISLDFGEGAKTARLAAIDESLADVAPKIVAAQAKYDAEKVKEDEARKEAQAAAESYASVVAASNLLAGNATLGGGDYVISPAVKNAYDLYVTATNKLLLAMKAIGPVLSALNSAKEFKAAAQKQRDYWAGLQLTETRPAWCADYTEDATGEVATIEVPGEDKTILIAPSAPAWSGADGVVWAREIQRHDQLFWNAAVLPGWQKWKPTYRTGVITALYADDTADVKLDDAKSSAQGLSINQTSTLKAVPVRYMDCNAAAFEVDDKVVVHFKAQDWAQPEVIGFVTNPKACNWPCIYGFEDWYQYFFQNKLSESQPLTMSELMFSGASVQARENRGAWVDMAFSGYFDLGGGNRYNQFLYRFEENASHATLLVGYGFVLGYPGELATLFDGVWLRPPLKARADDQPADVPMVHEFKITINGEIKFNCAIYSNRGTGFITNKVGRVRAKGGIQLVPISMPVTQLDYALGD